MTQTGQTPSMKRVSGGGRSWLRGNLGQIYAERHDLLPMLRSSQAPGRDYVLLATDESVPAYLNFAQPPPPASSACGRRS